MLEKTNRNPGGRDSKWKDRDSMMHHQGATERFEGGIEGRRREGLNLQEGGTKDEYGKKDRRDLVKVIRKTKRGDIRVDEHTSRNN
ncbi:hypothetical protein C922_05170 [Plasmodium inui San Antonio 1]|uniref:Uncharacterized protein n=1 Tax=Plasmodium inui San Antonio 1 TaxID=1237626 RepID=W7AGM5_9APIC|nr:hypothetical protein C922_05170 [Plasmodium inui San Antonio 1]EUD64456.1 hypothetical protein C922_05170 [Plasmodium inui San Antonio 1]